MVNPSTPDSPQVEAITRYDASTGIVSWSQLITPPYHGYVSVESLGLDGNGHLWVAGRSTESDTANRHIFLGKYEAESGTKIWEHLDPLQIQDDYIPLHMAFDPEGNVILAGHWDPRFFWTAKYSKTDGALLWKQAFPEPILREFRLGGLAVDHDGNVVASALSGNNARTVKYEGTSGAVLWARENEQTPTAKRFAPFALAVDSEGNVIISGDSTLFELEMDDDSLDFHTIKYAAEDGATLWEQTYDGPAHAGEHANVAALDSQGNAIIAGYTRTSHHGRDMLIYKLAANTGQPLWEQTYNGPANGHDEVVAMAIDSEGNVIITGTITLDPPPEIQERWPRM